MDIIKQIPGQYEFVNNGRATSSTPIAKSSIKLEKNNRTSGGINSTWKINQKNNKIILTIKDNNGHQYLGEFRLQQDESKNHNRVLTFAALGNNEVIWGEKI